MCIGWLHCGTNGARVRGVAPEGPEAAALLRDRRRVAIPRLVPGRNTHPSPRNSSFISSSRPLFFSPRPRWHVGEDKETRREVVCPRVLMCAYRLPGVAMSGWSRGRTYRLTEGSSPPLFRRPVWCVAGRYPRTRR